MSNDLQTAKKILICGDSFCDPDIMYPGLHFSEKVAATPGIEVINFAVGGASNAMIAAQFLQGLMFDPDFVVFGFTNDARYEYDKSKPERLMDVNTMSVKKFQQSRYTTNCYYQSENVRDSNKIMARWRYGVASDSMEKLKNYFFIAMCLSTCEAAQIPFCFSLGGFEHKLDYRTLLEQNYVKNLFDRHNDKQLSINLWHHYDGKTMSPSFHIANENVQTQYAAECVKFIEEQLC